jgi:hypothetical protein
MENQNPILGLYRKFTSSKPNSVTDRVEANTIEHGYFLRKEGSEEFFPMFLRRGSEELFPVEGDCPPDLVTRINKEKNDYPLSRI